MNDMFFDPELLKLWGAPAAMVPPMAGMELAKVQTAAPPPPIAGTDAAAATALPLPAGGTDGGATVPPTTKPEAFGSGGPKDRQSIDLVALLRGLAGILPRPTAPERQAAIAASAPPFHRPQAGQLPIRQAIPGNPYLRTAAIRPRRRGLLDEG